MFNFPGTVLIDDDKEELYELLGSVAAAGIPCLPIEYLNEADNKTGIDHIKLTNIKPRIIITDLNLTESGNMDATFLVGPIAKVLEPLTNFGPYILLFWSKNEDLVQEVVEKFTERFHDSMNLPIHCEVISKSELKGKPEELKAKIENLIKENALFNAISDWENRIAFAAQKTSNSLYELTLPKNYAPENKTQDHQEQLKSALALIGNQTIGIKNALEYPSLAIDLGLIPLLQDQLLLAGSAKTLWETAVPSIGNEHGPISHEVKSALNTFCHLEEVDGNFPKDSRGVFVNLHSDNLDIPDKLHKLEDRLGNKIENIIHGEFLSERLCFSDDKPKSRKFRKDAIKATKLGFVELSAVCDQAQKKTKLHRYVLSALIPETFSQQTEYETHGIFRNFSHEGIYRLPKIKIAGEIYILLLSFKYQIGTKPSSSVDEREYENSWFGTPLFRLKDQILSDISFKSAQYASRPGITRFD